MTSFKSVPKKVQNSMGMEQQSETQVPITKNKSTSSSQLFCQNHSSPSKKQSIKFININYFQSNKKKQEKTEISKQTIKNPFLCGVCYSELRKNKNYKQKLQNIISIQQFQNQYISSVLKTYSNIQQESQLTNKFKLIQNAEQVFNKEITKITQEFKKDLQIYRNIFSEIFKALRKPLNKESIRKFNTGQFNEEIIREFYSNSKKVKAYSSLIEQKNEESLKYTCDCLKQSLDEIQSIMKKKLFQSQHLLKEVIKVYKFPELTKQLREDESKPPAKGHILERIRKMNAQRKIQLQKKRQERQNKQINSSQDQESEKEQKMGLRSERKKLPSQRSTKVLKKHKIIRRQRIQKPSSRINNVHIIAQDFLLKEDKVIVLYIVNKTYTERVQSEKVNRLTREEFKSKYPEAYNTFQCDEIRKRNRS